MKEAKFKVGDKVRILDGSKIVSYTGTWSYSMHKYVGRIATIAEIEPFCDGRTSYSMKEFGYCWDERGLEPAEEVKNVVIWRTGNRVYAKDSITKEQAVARCNPEDTFDFLTGAKLALERLCESSRPLAVGDDVRIINTGKIYTNSVQWVLDNVRGDSLKIRYAYGQSLGYPETIRLDDKFRIKVIEDNKAYIEQVGRYACDGPCYVIGLAGLERW